MPSLVVKDRVRETTTTTGTGTVLLAGSVTGFQSFSEIGDTNTTYYAIVDAATGDWEVGIGTYSSAGTGSLSRNTVLESSNNNSLVPFLAGTKDVFCTYPAERSVYADGSTLASPAANFTTNGIPYASSTSALTTGSALTFNGSTLATTGALTVNGNTTLGNATSDQVTVNGYMGVGASGAPNSGRAIAIQSAALSGATQVGVYSNITGTSAAITGIDSFYSLPATANATYTAARVSGFYADTAILAGTSTITNAYGVYVADQTNGTNNYGVASAISLGTNKWNIYANGTAPNYFVGNVGIGTTAPDTLLHLSGVNTAVIRLENTDSLVANQIIGGLEFEKADGSGAGAGVVGGLRMYSEDSLGASTYLALSTSSSITNNVERMRITSVGNIGLGGGGSSNVSFYNQKAISGGTTAYANYTVSTVQSDVAGISSIAYGHRTALTTAAAAFTLNNLTHYAATQTTLGAGSTVTNQIGFHAQTGLVGAINNYGFVSDIDAAAGRWNFYANGTANNHFAGNISIGLTAAPEAKIDVQSGTQFDPNLARTTTNLLARSTGTAGALAYGGAITLAQINSSRPWGAIAGVQYQADPDQGGMAFFVHSGTASNDVVGFAMIIEATGNVGIATTTPKGLLHVVGGGTVASGIFASSGADTTNLGATPPLLNVLFGSSLRSWAPSTETEFLLERDGNVGLTLAVGASGTASINFGDPDDEDVGEILYVHSDNSMRFNTNAVEAMRITSAKNLKIGGTANRATTEGTNQLVMFNGTAPVGALTNGVSFYSAAGEARVMDAAGNSTLLSPHDQATNEWIFHSKHTPTGKVLRIDVEKMLRFINDHFGLDMIQEFTEE